jgi:hypothetical protein
MKFISGVVGLVAFSITSPALSKDVGGISVFKTAGEWRLSSASGKCAVMLSDVRYEGRVGYHATLHGPCAEGRVRGLTLWIPGNDGVWVVTPKDRIYFGTSTRDGKGYMTEDGRMELRRIR